MPIVESDHSRQPKTGKQKGRQLLPPFFYKI
jgi:hypothetical protein